MSITCRTTDLDAVVDCRQFASAPALTAAAPVLLDIAACQVPLDVLRCTCFCSPTPSSPLARGMFRLPSSTALRLPKVGTVMG